VPSNSARPKQTRDVELSLMTHLLCKCGPWIGAHFKPPGVNSAAGGGTQVL
jgi:hypothetical protein